MSRSTCGNTSARYGWSRQLSKRFVRRLASPSWWLSLTWINATCESFLVTHSAHTRRYRSGRPSVTQKTCLASASRSFLGAIVLPTQQCCTTHSLPITKKTTTTTSIRDSWRSCTFCLISQDHSAPSRRCRDRTEYVLLALCVRDGNRNACCAQVSSVRYTSAGVDCMLTSLLLLCQYRYEPAREF